MQDTSEATTATHFPARPAQDAGGFRLVARAPGPEVADSRDKSGMRKGMIILLASGVGFWGAVAAVAVHLLH
jgi:hypothetical protein